MKTYQTHTVSAEHAGLTLEAYLKQVLHYSGRKIQQLTRQKGLYLNGRTSFLRQPLKSNDTVRVLALEDSGYGVEPQPGAIEILYEDDALLILNKPPGQLVHPAGRTSSGTLANYLAQHLAERGILRTIRPVHRLDRDTSGCIIFAKDARSQSLLEQQLASGALKRTYWALVQGQLTPPAATISAAIGPHPSLANRRAVSTNGETAITHYRTLRVLGDTSLLELTLATGRTHQIRVHLDHIGHPVIGDRMYGIRSPLLPRQALHAVAVSFNHLRSNQPVSVCAPLPPDMARAIARAEAAPPHYEVF
ncbi:MAG: RluA family pseudouridine synthase [Sporomusaceae bacterium]|nr:RluA family pseudouridine synthase [Sporomusaceae bacterium]